MAVISKGPFGGVTITGDDAKRFIERMNNVKYNPKLAAAVERGRSNWERMKAAELIQHNENLRRV